MQHGRKIVTQLQNNAIESIQLGFEDFFLSNEDPRRINSSIRNIHSGIVLLLLSEIEKRSPQKSKDALIKKKHIFKVVGEHVTVEGHGDHTIGKQDAIKNLSILGVDLKKEEKQKLDNFANFRNKIEHHYTDKTKPLLEQSILEAFRFIKDFNNNYSELSQKDLFGDDIWKKLIDIEENHDIELKKCHELWKKNDLNSLKERTIYLFEDSDYAPDDIYTIFNCEKCGSDLVSPLTFNCSNKIDISMKCIKCDNQFNYSSFMEIFLQKHYAYAIMKVGSKGGHFPLSICSQCKFGTFLNYDDICLYCGNKTYDTSSNDEFENVLFTNNVNLYSDYW